jgi:hypothetical protein
MNIHYQMPYAAVVVQFNHGMPYPYPREPIDLIAGQRISLSGDVLYRDCVMPEHRQKAVSLYRRGVAGKQQDQWAEEKGDAHFHRIPH